MDSEIIGWIIILCLSHLGVFVGGCNYEAADKKRRDNARAVELGEKEYWFNPKTGEAELRDTKKGGG